jgi:hypothetical protein
MTRRPLPARRRNNAPVRPRRRPSTIVPDILLALSALAFTMAVIFLAASFLSEDVTAGEAGEFLARAFAGALAMTGLFLALLAFGLLGEDRGYFGQYLAPILLGILAGAIEAVLFLIPLGALLWAPFLLLFFAPQAVRRHLPGPLRAARTSD